MNNAFINRRYLTGLVALHNLLSISQVIYFAMITSHKKIERKLDENC